MPALWASEHTDQQSFTSMRWLDSQRWQTSASVAEHLSVKTKLLSSKVSSGRAADNPDSASPSAASAGLGPPPSRKSASDSPESPPPAGHPVRSRHASTNTPPGMDKNREVMPPIRRPANPVAGKARTDERYRYAASRLSLMGVAIGSSR